MTSLLLTLVILAADPPPASAGAIERLQALHLAEARKWQMYVAEDRQTKATLNEKPIYVWTNPTRSHGQHGAVYVWTHGGRPVAIGSIFSHPETGKRMVCHEFHSLGEGSLFPQRSAEEQTWQPKAAVPLLRLSGASRPEGTPGRRLIQMRSLAREFTAHSIDYQEERWDMRLLPQPLYRYEKPQGDVVDGALFAFVTSAGTDPEVIVALEARKDGEALAWHYRAIRFSDSNLYVQYAGKEVWTSIRDDRNQLHFNPDHTYRLIRDRAIDELPELVVAAPQE
jgi:hypothetical protein